MNFALALAGDHLPGVTLNLVASLPPSSFRSPQTEELALEQTVLGEPVSGHTRAIILQQSADPGLPTQAAQAFAPTPLENQHLLSASASSDPQAASITGLLLGSPEFQRR